MKEVRLGAARREQGDIDHFFLGFQETVLQRGKIPLVTYFVLILLGTRL
jgi:hypothetical protein